MSTQEKYEDIVVKYAVSGAIIGAVIGGPAGAAIAGLIGAALGEEEAKRQGGGV